jgi:hypothetical protein
MMGAADGGEDYPYSSLGGGLRPSSLLVHMDASKVAKAPTLAVRLRNFVLTILMMSFPIGIFLLPLWLRTRSYPRIVVSLTTIPERLPHIRPTLESLLYDQTVTPTVVYLILPQQDYYGSQTPKHYDDPWPDFLTHMVETTQLEILQPTSDYGPITKVLHALEKEKQWSDEQEMRQQKSSVSQNSNTRIVYLDDDVQYHRQLIQLLVDASLEYELDGDASAVVALSGGRLRNKFRQIKHSNRNYDKAPNLYMEVSWDNLAKPQPVDIVQGFTGVCLHAQDGWNWLPSIYSVLLRNSDNNVVVPKAVLQSDDVLLSAVMERFNSTRWVVPGMAHRVQVNTNSSQVAPLSKGMHSNLIEATYYLQQQWGIWNNYELLDWSTLTPEQLEAIHCEAKHVQDCSTSVCVPNPKHCPDAHAVLQDLSSP